MIADQMKKRAPVEFQESHLDEWPNTGSTVSLIHEDVNTKIVDHSRLSKINTVLYGLGQTEVITKGSFQYDFVLDKDQYSLTWHVVPTKQLNFEAITARRLSYAEKKSVNKHIEEWIEQGIVRPSSSEYASPIVLVKNKKTYNKKRKKFPEYQVGDLVAVQRTQFGGGLKIRPKFFRPYHITEVKPRDRYIVEKVRDHAGPNVTATSADLMKYFSHY
ncbi:peptidase A2 domain-containing protein [Trichonephila clavipes]|nr:peptidase A2 domain-containing protein [Trichonephila clavipes]